METTMKFPAGFERYACVGDTLRWSPSHDSPLSIVATIVEDDCPDSPDERGDGFFPSRDPSAPGYVAPDKYDTEADHANDVMAKWMSGEWRYVGVVLSVLVGETELESHAASLWGVECNYPTHPERPDENPNDHLTEVANELLPEAITQARDNLICLSCDLDRALSDATLALMRSRLLALQ